MTTPFVDLPITRVVLYSSGVGYFEHEGTVEDDAVMRLLFSAEQINDALRSLVLADLDGGSVHSVTYPTLEPLEKSLQSFEIDIAKGLSLSTLLQQVRGSSIRVHGERVWDGVVMDVETVEPFSLKDPSRPVEHALVLRTAEGIERIPLSSVERFEFSEPQLQAELDQALALLAAARNTHRRPLDVRFSGKGVRRVRFGYLQEAAVWKTSYRLDLTAEPPRLQGWAMIDNASGTDWKGVQLSLVSGRPLSFMPDLYSPRFVPRPGDPDGAPDQLDLRALRAHGNRHGDANQRQTDAEARAAPMLPSCPAARFAACLTASAEEVAGTRAGRDAQARGEAAGELVAFTLEDRATIPRRGSATMPLLAVDANAKRASTYDASLNREHPLCSVTVKNLSETTWMPGPITIYDGGIYAGDSEIGYVAPGSRQFLSYALDLELRIETTSKATTTSHVVASAPGFLLIEHREDAIRAYRVHNKSDGPKSLVLKQDMIEGAELLCPDQAWQKQRGQYLFLLELEPDERGDFSVVQRKRTERVESVVDVETRTLREWMKAQNLTPELREVLQRVLQIREQLSVLEGTERLTTTELEEIIEDQTRVSTLLQKVGGDTEAGHRYTAKLNSQESSIERLRSILEDVRADLSSKRQELREAAAVPSAPSSTT